MHRTAQLDAQDLGFAHGPHVVLDGVTLTVASGHRIGITGPNGSGKSTLLSLLVGAIRPERGEVRRVPGDARVGHLHQELPVGPTETVGGFVRRITGVDAAQRALDAATAALAADEPRAATRYSDALDAWTEVGAADLDRRLDAALAQVGFPADRLDQRASTLSGGERARVGLATILVGGFDLLALDEPTNDLDLAGLAVLEDFLVRSDAGLVVVSHDRAFLERVVTSVVEIDEHSRTATRYDGGWQAYQEARATARRHAEERHADYVATRDALRGQAQRTREWSAKGIARSKRSGETDKFIRHHDVATSEKLVGKAARAERALERLEVVDKPWEGWDLRLLFAHAPRAGTDAVVARDVTVARGGFRLGPVSLDLGADERVAVVGANGSGKTTLIRLLTGQDVPDAGSVAHGPATVLGVLDQARARFASDRSLLDTFLDDTGLAEEPDGAAAARSQLAKLGLGAAAIARPTRELSPGERTRAVLAAFALRGVNLLILDEPTNHLDLPAIEQLESALEAYTGTVVVVSHDRRFLEHLRITRRLVLAGGQLVEDAPASEAGGSAVSERR